MDGHTAVDASPHWPLSCASISGFWMFSSLPSLDGMSLRISVVLVLLLGLWAPTALAQETTYTVVDGDFLGRIAERHGVTVRQLREWNNLDGDRINVGQNLVIRGGTRPSSQTGNARVHIVAPGENLGAIAQRHNVSVEEILSWNRGVRNPDSIRVGQELEIRGTGRPTRQTTYVVQPGEIAGEIARRQRVSVNDLVAWNPGLDPNRIRVGQELVIVQEGPEIPSESVGRANDGRLVNGEQLPPHRAYTIRDPDRAWGTNETITFIIDGFDHMSRVYGRNLPRVRVHDLSLESGGRMRGHRSHQSGRDADIGYYLNNCDGECEYRNISPDELDVEKQWELLHFWIRNGMVEYVFVDYRLQRAMYEWLVEEGASTEDLQAWFQYPRGRDSTRGIIRHEPNHANHIHVRFSCGSDDDRCR